MHSDSHTSDVQVISRMDAFWEASRANERALTRYVESLYCRAPIQKPTPLVVPSVDDEEMEFLMEFDISRAARVAALMSEDGEDIVAYYLPFWVAKFRNKSKYLAYNRHALEKRYAKGADAAEIDRVKKLISDGEAELAFLQPRIEWAEGFTS